MVANWTFLTDHAWAMLAERPSPAAWLGQSLGRGSTAVRCSAAVGLRRLMPWRVPRSGSCSPGAGSVTVGTGLAVVAVTGVCGRG